MSANNYPQFDAAVSELTDRVESLIGRVQQTETYHNIERSEAFATESEEAAASATASATQAAASATTASTKASEASTSATNAAASATTATTKAGEASTSATNAGNAQAKALKWAEESENTAVEAGKYSAKHHAAKAAASATTASTKAGEASTSATNAAASATTATTKAGEASTSATNAGNAQAKALKWAEEPENTAVEAGKYSAKHHAAKAAASATTASTKASEASTSATNASTSAVVATTKASEASTSAGNASASATTATTKAGEASASASSASGSASTATTKAADAAASSSKAQAWADAGVDVAVETGKYSAKHHASKASASSAAASASEAAALVSKQAAQAAESSAAASAAQAQTYRDQAQAAATTLTGNLVELGGIDLSSGVYPTKPSNGSFWKVTVGGTVSGEVYGVGDTLVYSKNLDQFYKIDNTESVSSVNGETGTVTVTPAKIGALPVGGTAAAATKLATARTIGGVAFDGSANINLPGVNAAGNQNTSGNAATATKLQTARTISLGGDLTGSVAFDGSDNALLNASLPARLGKTAQLITDWNLAVENGYYQGSDALNAPSAGWIIGHVISHGAAGWVTQDVFSFSGDSPADSKAFRREQNGGSWGSWYRLRTTEAEQSALYNNASNLSSGTVPDGRLSGTYTGVNIAGNAATATKLKTALTISLTGDLTGSANFDGSDNVSIDAQVANDSHTHSLANLGLGNAATATVQTSPTDTTAGRLMAVGAFGQGAGVQLTVENAPDTCPPGMYGFTAERGWASRPTSQGLGNLDGWWKIISCKMGGANYALQLAQPWAVANSGTLFVRSIEGGTLNPWRLLYSQSTIIGTVSQSAGVPTGAIIQRGSNANGEYVRFADGTQICWKRTFRLTQFGTSSTMLETQWSFPASFSNTDVVTFISHSNNGTRRNELDIANFKRVFSDTNTGVGSVSIGMEFTSGVTAASWFDIPVYAIGRWY